MLICSRLLPVLIMGAACLTLSAFAQNQVTNPGFETGNFIGWTLEQPYDQYLFVSGNGTAYGSSHSGGLFAVLAGYSVPFDAITQTIPTQMGQEYNFSFWLRTNGDTSSHADEFKASFGNAVLLDDLNRAKTDWTQYSYMVTATSNATPLQFAGAIGDTFWALDDVSVVPSGAAVPETSRPDLLVGVAFLGGSLLLSRRQKQSRQNRAFV